MEEITYEINKLLNLVDEIQDSDSKMYIKREDDVISYGLEDNSKYFNFNITDNKDLEKVYKAIMDKYQEEAVDALAVDEDRIPTLYVIIDNKSVITIDSDNLDDYKWFENPNYDDDKVKVKKIH